MQKNLVVTKKGVIFVSVNKAKVWIGKEQYVESYRG